MLNRRDFLKLGSLLFTGGVFNRIQSDDNKPAPPTHKYQGANFKDWEVALGDAIYKRLDDNVPVSISDIETVDENGYSELRANIHHRIIKAHNITFKRIINSKAFDFIHTCSYSFRIPFVPEQDINADLNAQTVEGGVFVWDGKDTQLDYGMAFQWSLNPWDEFGNIRAWTDKNTGEWVDVGYLTPDTEWHHVKMTVDFHHGTTALIIDNENYPIQLTRLPKPPEWGTEIAARLQAEIVSIDPEPSGMTAMHKAEFKHWRWTWEASKYKPHKLPF